MSHNTTLRYMPQTIRSGEWDRTAINQSLYRRYYNIRVVVIFGYNDKILSKVNNVGSLMDSKYKGRG